MADERPRVFISYSRHDSDFAYRLRADLEASGFETWIDTAKLDDQGGQEWLRLIQNAVDASQAMVVIVSPESVQSRYVHMEYHRAQSQNKLVVPIHHHTTTSAPMDLALDQWIDFREEQGAKDAYQAGLTSLLRSLTKAPAPPRYPDLPQAPAATPLTIAEGADMPSFRPVWVPPPQPPEELATLMTAAYDARGKNDLASEQYFIQQIVTQDPNFLDGRFKHRLEEVTREIEAQRVQRLRALAYDAAQAKQWRRALGAWQALHDIRPNDIEAQAGARQARVARAEEALRDGEFDEAVGTWQALLKADSSDAAAQAGLRTALRARADDAWNRADWTRAAESWATLSELTPPDPDAQDFLGAIAQNQRGDPLYQSAQRSLAAGNADGARVALKDLYRNVAPYYGDPQGLTAKVGLPTPPNLTEEKDGRAQQKRLEEQRQAGLAEQARQAGAQRQAAIAEQQRIIAANQARSRSRWSWPYVFGICFWIVALSAEGAVIASDVSAKREVISDVALYLFWLYVSGVFFIEFAFYYAGYAFIAWLVRRLSTPQNRANPALLANSPVEKFPSNGRKVGVILTYVLAIFIISIVPVMLSAFNNWGQPGNISIGTAIGTAIGLGIGLFIVEALLRRKRKQVLLQQLSQVVRQPG